MNTIISEKDNAHQGVTYPNAGVSSILSALVLFLERMAYYGARGFIVLFFLKDMALETTEAYAYYGLLGGATFLAPGLCGWVTDHFLDKRLAMLIGNMLAGLGIFMIATTNGYLVMAGMALWAVGSGAVRPPLLTYFGEMVASFGKSRLDGAYTLLYVAINLGALLAPIVLVKFAETEGYVPGFIVIGAMYLLIAGLCGIGMGTEIMDKEMDTDTLTDAPKPAKKGIAWAGAGVIVGVAVLFAILMMAGLNTDIAMVLNEMKVYPALLIIMGGLALAIGLTPQKVIGTLVAGLGIFAMVFFWAGFEVTGYNYSVVGRQVMEELGVNIVFFTSLNPLFTILFGLVLGGLTVGLVSKRYDLLSGIKVVSGIVLTILGMMITLGAAGKEGIAEQVIAGVALLSLGEILLAPVVMSLIFRYSPRQARATMMGVFIGGTSFLANWVGGLAWSDRLVEGNIVLPETWLRFFVCLGICLLAGVGLLVFLATRKVESAEA